MTAGISHQLSLWVGNYGYALIEADKRDQGFTPLPIIDDVSPLVGSTRGGTRVTITGKRRQLCICISLPALANTCLQVNFTKAKKANSSKQLVLCVNLTKFAERLKKMRLCQLFSPNHVKCCIQRLDWILAIFLIVHSLFLTLIQEKDLWAELLFGLALSHVTSCLRLIQKLSALRETLEWRWNLICRSASLVSTCTTQYLKGFKYAR